MFADFEPAPIDRLMGRILVDRTMEMLVSVHHPKLRRFVASSGRARMSGVLVEQDGIYAALHAVSREGMANYLDQPAIAKAHGMPVWGYDFPPGRAAIQSLRSPWAPDWVAGLVDDKPVPFEETSAETTAATSSRRCGGAPGSAPGMVWPAPTSATARSTCWASGCAQPRWRRGWRISAR